MILHIGTDVIIPLCSVVAILDLETAGNLEYTERFLKEALNNGSAEELVDGRKSCVVTSDKGKTKVYFSPISSMTLYKRCGYIEDIGL